MKTVRGRCCRCRKKINTKKPGSGLELTLGPCFECLLVLLVKKTLPGVRVLRETKQP